MEECYWYCILILTVLSLYAHLTVAHTQKYEDGEQKVRKNDGCDKWWHVGVVNLGLLCPHFILDLFD